MTTVNTTTPQDHHRFT